MIDIHSHILPGVDDGSKDIEMSIEMARIYEKNNIKKVIATPHYIEGVQNSTLEENKIALEALNHRLEEEQIDLEVCLGNEIMISLDILKDLEESNLSTLNGSKYILIEFPMFDIPNYTENILHELLLRGYHPIIAHPERNRSIGEDPNILFRLIEDGALAQLNLGSIEGKFGKKIKENAELLLNHNMIHFVSTDAHRSNTRTPNVANALNILRKIVSKEDYDRITYENANYILDNKDIKIKSPTMYKNKKNFFTSFFNKYRPVYRNGI